MGRLTYEEQLEAEARTWCLPDRPQREEKAQRERMRHFKLCRDLLLDELDTGHFTILEVGGGPQPLSDLLKFTDRVVVDPCTDSYREYFRVPDHVSMKIEDYDNPGVFDLAICTNALDHVENPMIACGIMADSLRGGGWLAIVCNEDNALVHPHPAHVHNLKPSDIHTWLDSDFETVWELNFDQHGYRYGWVEYDGKRGQPAFAMLLRKCTGYA